jgi:hypothetical protein
MEIPTNEEIKLMDDILVMKFNGGNPSNNYSDADYSKNFKVTKDMFRFAFNKMCELGKNLAILKAEQGNDGTYYIVEFEKHQCKKFIDAGGVKGYFSKLESENKKELNTSIINHGIIQQGSGNTASQDFSHSKTKTKPKEKSTVKEIFIGIFITVIGGLILWYITK